MANVGLGFKNSTSQAYDRVRREWMAVLSGKDQRAFLGQSPSGQYDQAAKRANPIAGPIKGVTETRG